MIHCPVVQKLTSRSWSIVLLSSAFPLDHDPVVLLSSAFPLDHDPLSCCPVPCLKTMIHCPVVQCLTSRPWCRCHVVQCLTSRSWSRCPVVQCLTSRSWSRCPVVQCLSAIPRPSYIIIGGSKLSMLIWSLRLILIHIWTDIDLVKCTFTSHHILRIYSINLCKVGIPVYPMWFLVLFHSPLNDWTSRNMTIEIWW